MTGDGPPPGLFSQHSGYADPSTAAASNAGNGKQLQNGASPPTAATPVTANHAVFLPPKSNGIEYEVELEHPHGKTLYPVVCMPSRECVLVVVYLTDTSCM